MLPQADSTLRDDLDDPLKLDRKSKSSKYLSPTPTKFFFALSHYPSRCMDNMETTTADAAVAMAVDMAVVVAMEEDVVDETTSPLLMIITASYPSSLP